MYWETLPKELLNAFMADADFDFDDGEIFHMRMMPPTYKEEALKGWGLPAFMSSFETVLRTMFEAGFRGDVYPSPQMWAYGGVGTFSGYPFPAGLDRMRTGGF